MFNYCIVAVDELGSRYQVHLFASTRAKALAAGMEKVKARMRASGIVSEVVSIVAIKEALVLS